MGFVLCVLWCGLLIRTWACCSESGQPRPRTGQAARVRKKGYSPTPGSPQCAQARYVEPGPSHPHVGLLFRVWATPPMYGTGGPRAEQAARVRNRRPACGTRWSPSCFVQVPVGGGPPARSPHARLRLGVVDLEARPGPAAALGHRFCPRVPQPSLLLPSEPGGCCGGMRQAVAVFDRCGIAK